MYETYLILTLTLQINIVEIFESTKTKYDIDIN